MPEPRKPDMIEMIKKQMQEAERKKIFENIGYSAIKGDLRKEMIKRAAEEVSNNPYLAKKKPEDGDKSKLSVSLRAMDERRNKK